LEGKFRPTHFKGVTTVVLKLFNIVQPHKSFFGQKDAQQSVVIKKMTRDLNISTEIVIIPTVRESDGLAMSSRNVYLTPSQRSDAPILNAALQFAKRKIESGERNTKILASEMHGMISEKAETTIDYIEFVDAETLHSVEIVQSGMTVLIPLAVRFGSTRLIDNIIVTVR
jgi:pantoate--beta-alanine ligase